MATIPFTSQKLKSHYGVAVIFEKYGDDWYAEIRVEVQSAEYDSVNGWIYFPHDYEVFLTEWETGDDDEPNRPRPSQEVVERWASDCLEYDNVMDYLLEFFAD